jgi:hypothetical protein
MFLTVNFRGTKGGNALTEATGRWLFESHLPVFLFRRDPLGHRGKIATDLLVTGLSFSGLSFSGLSFSGLPLEVVGSHSFVFLFRRVPRLHRGNVDIIVIYYNMLFS